MSSRPDLAVSLEAFYHYLTLSLVLPEIPEDLFLIWVVLTDPLKAALHEALEVSRVESQSEIEDLSVKAMVVTYGSPAGEGLLPLLPHRMRPLRAQLQHTGAEEVEPSSTVGGHT